MNLRGIIVSCIAVVSCCAWNHSAAQTAVELPPAVSSLAMPPLAAQIGIVSTGGGFSIQDKAEVVKNLPYQAQAVTEFKQTLADGSHISQSTTATAARDSEGRTVRIQKLSQIGPWKSSSESAQGNGPTLTSIFDPVAKEHIDYTSDKKVAHLMSIPELPEGANVVMGNTFSVTAVGPPSGGMNVMYSVQGHAAASPADASEVKTEQLGTRDFDGIQATGTRTSSTIPAGTIGNEKDIVVTRETWYASDLHLVVESTQDDPRFGQTTYALKNIQQGEPDETLFQVPSGYTIEKLPIVKRMR